MAKKLIRERGRTPTQQPAKVAQQDRYTIDEALAIFVEAKQAEGVRPRTVEKYYDAKMSLTKYADVGYIDELTPKLLREYIRYLQTEIRPYEGVQGRESSGKKGLSVTTINIHLRTLRTMCRFWHGEGMLSANPMATIKLVRDDEQEEVPGFTDAELDRIFSALDERQFAQWRDKCLIWALLDVGLRITEATSLTEQQVDFERCELEVPSQVAKNRKHRYLPMSRSVAKKLQQLHNESIEYFGDHDRIFVNAYGEPLTASAFRRRLHRLKQRLGLPRLHPHQFRHTFARNYILNGGDLVTLQRILDHADIETTRRYVQMDDADVRRQHAQYSPVKRWLKR